MGYSHKGTDQHILKTSETESVQKISEGSVGINNTSSRFWPKQTFTITQGYIKVQVILEREQSFKEFTREILLVSTMGIWYIPCNISLWLRLKAALVGYCKMCMLKCMPINLFWRENVWFGFLKFALTFQKI